jgi:hypothetical protein
MAKRRTDARYRGSAEDDLDEATNRQLVRAGSKRIVLKALHHETKIGRMRKFDEDGRTWIGLT